MLIMLEFVTRTGFGINPTTIIFILNTALLLVMGVVILHKIIRPYYEVNKIYTKFANGEIYEELFESEYMITPEWNLVMKRMRHLLNKQDALKMSEKQAEYLALQNQINPHFLYNTLEAIRGDAICAKLYSIAEITEALSVFFRYSISGVDKLVDLEEELDNVENYFKIQYYRFEDKLDLKIDCLEELKQFQVPKLTIQPFVENAIFHGIEKKRYEGRVTVTITSTMSQLLVVVSDNGVGMEEENVKKTNDYLDKVAVSYVGDGKKSGGIGMKNVNSRIKLLFGENYGVTIYSTRNIGTDIHIRLPKLKRGEYEEREITN